MPFVIRLLDSMRRIRYVLTPALLPVRSTPFLRHYLELSNQNWSYSRDRKITGRYSVCGEIKRLGADFAVQNVDRVSCGVDRTKLIGRRFDLRALIYQLR